MTWQCTPRRTGLLDQGREPAIRRAAEGGDRGVWTGLVGRAAWWKSPAWPQRRGDQGLRGEHRRQLIPRSESARILTMRRIRPAVARPARTGRWARAVATASSGGSRSDAEVIGARYSNRLRHHSRRALDKAGHYGRTASDKAAHRFWTGDGSHLTHHRESEARISTAGRGGKVEAELRQQLPRSGFDLDAQLSRA